MIFHNKVLIGVMAVLVLAMGVRFGFPELAAVFSTDYIIFFTGGLGLMTIMHMTGYDEGYTKGYIEGVEYGKTTLHKN